MPGVSGVTVVTNARAYYHYTRGCGRTKRPAFPAPSVERGPNKQSKTRAERAAGMRSHIFRRCAERGDEAIHACFLAVVLWIASLRSQ
jgi:hypothetical protein